LHASQAAEILALGCRFLDFANLEGWPSLVGFICLAFGGDGIIGLKAHASFRSANTSVRMGYAWVILSAFFFPTLFFGVNG